MSRYLEMMLRWIYTLLFAMVVPVLVLRRWLKDRPYPDARGRWLEYLGFYKQPALPPGGVWIHAVSFGELVAVLPFIRACLKRFPTKTIIVTTTTPTASAHLRKTLGTSVAHVYFPYDVPFCMNRFLGWSRPAIALIVETELWPNCLVACEKSAVPVLIISACLSLRSWRGYQRCKPLIRGMLDRVHTVCAQSKRDADRFFSLGLKTDRLMISGNIKFDQTLPEGAIEQGLALRAHWGTSRPVLMAASTHAREEEALLSAFEALRSSFSDLMLVIAPRHPERFDSVYALVLQKSFSVARRSLAQIPGVDTAVYLADTLGELNRLYSAADIVFVGGSLVPIGGHNVLEPALVGVPVMVGPHMEDTFESMQLLQKAGALIQVHDTAALVSAVATWLGDPLARKQAGIAAQAVVERNRGALDKTLACVEAVLHDPVIPSKAGI